MLSKFYLVIIPILFSVVITYAQSIGKCGSSAYQSLNDKRFGGYKAARLQLENQIAHARLKRTTLTGVLQIPVVVHIIYNKTQSNISDEKVFTQIQILNEDYRRKNIDSINTPAEFLPFAADTRIQFCLANRDPEGNVTNGIIRKRTDRINFSGFDDEEDDRYLKSLSYWPSDQYLNIWVTTLASDIIGYSWYPESALFPDLFDRREATLDGVVIHYAAFGGNTSNTYKYNQGRTTTHEVGHWLGLKHIWGDDICGDDFIADTPMQESNNLALQRDGNCTHFSNCIGQLTRDMSANYMDYSPDKCMNLFTKGQALRMHAVMESNSRRLAIQESPGCCDSVNVLALPFFQGFERPDFLSEGWSVNNAGKDVAWQRTSVGAYGKSNFSLFLEKTLTNSTQVDAFLSLPLDFTKVANPKLSFALAYAQNAGTVDSVVVAFNSNCKSFLPLATYLPDQFTTGNPSATFTPDNTQWKTFVVDLKPLAGKKIAQIAFQIYSDASSRFFIDDINIYNSQSSFSIDLYPNPTNMNLTAQIGLIEPSEILFNLYNSIGQPIRTWVDREQNLRKEIVVEDLPSGMYILKGVSLNQTVVKKFVVQK